MNAPRPVPRQVLVVDDERSMQLAMSLALRTDGWQVLTASHATQAEQIADRQSIQLVVLDYMLPETDGLVLAQRWRAAGNTVPILLVSAQTDGPVVWRALKLGIVDMIAKPMDPPQLRNRARAMVARHELAQQANRTGAMVRGLIALQRQQPVQALEEWRDEPLNSRAFALLRAFALQLAQSDEAPAALARVGWPTSWHLSGGPDIFVEYCRRTEELLSASAAGASSPRK